MTWTASSRVQIKCDDSIHKGEREFMLVTGVDVSAQRAIDAKGWKTNGGGTLHQCPECQTARLRGR